MPIEPEAKIFKPGVRLTLLSYNIHKGATPFKRKDILDEIRAAIRELNLDLVFLQEVIGEKKPAKAKKGKKLDPITIEKIQAKRDQASSQFEFIADQSWPYYAYAKNAVVSFGHYGNAVLSKYPIISWYQENISTNKLEQRGVLYCDLQIPKSIDNPEYRIHSYCLHLDLLHRGRKKQYQQIYDKIQEEVKNSELVIAAGDFNDWNQKSGLVFEDELGLIEVHKELHGDYGRTFPAKVPLLKLDRIYLKGFKLHRVEVLSSPKWKKLSDHAPLFAELEIQD